MWNSLYGHAITASRPLSYKKSPIEFNGIDAYRVNGTPADCVRSGQHFWDKPDVVLSGINLGPNLGNAMWHSGTLAAAKQAVLFGIKGIALSTPTDIEPDFDALDPFVEKALDLLFKTPFKSGQCQFSTQSQGVRWTRQSVRLYDNNIVPALDPMGRKHYWFTVIPLEPAEEGTDRWAIENHFVSITPFRLDLTNEAELIKAQLAYPIV
jgi:5'-nucleotidase